MTSLYGDLLSDVLAHRNELRTLADYVKRYGKRELEFEPGSGWAYSNYGFILLGVVIEKVTGHSYYDYVQQHIYAPAGMTRSGSPPEDRAVPDRAIGYTKLPGPTALLTASAPELLATWVPNTDWLLYRGSPAALGYSTVEDLARFAHALLNHKLLGPDATELLITGTARMSRKAEVAYGRGTRYAYGFIDARNAGGNGWVGHNTNWPGMDGDLRIYPSPATWSRCSRTPIRRQHSGSRTISTTGCPQTDKAAWLSEGHVRAARGDARRMRQCYARSRGDARSLLSMTRVARSCGRQRARYRRCPST